VTPKRGDRFVHRHQITPTCLVSDPVYETCTVTAVRRGSVYFVNSTGYKSVVSLSSFFTTTVRQWLGQ
jgi:hypothetical protein